MPATGPLSRRASANGCSATIVLRGRRNVLAQPSRICTTVQKKIVKNDGKTIAEGSDEKIAEDVAERLNAEEDRREEDRWA